MNPKFDLFRFTLQTDKFNHDEKISTPDNCINWIGAIRFSSISATGIV
jgi:hypothetical protein